jgi:hypothetical protein
MPTFYDKAGKPIEQMDEPSSPSSTPEVAPQGEEETSTLEKLGELGVLAGNSATLGLVPTIAGVFDADTKNKMLKHLEKSREDTGAAGTVAEILGGFATPIPGLGAAKGAGTLARVGMGALRGGVAGGLSSGLTRASEQPGGQFDPVDIAKATGTGALLGTGLGGAAGGVGSYMTHRANQAVFSAGGGTAGRIEHLARSYGVGAKKGLQKAKEAGEFAVEQGWAGGSALQSIPEGANKAFAAAETSGKKIGELIEKHGDNAEVPVSHIWNNIVTPVFDKFTARNISSAKTNKALENMMEEVSSMVGSKQKVNIKDVFRIKEELGDIIYGERGLGKVGDSTKEFVFSNLRSKISDLENEMMKKVNPALGKELVDNKEMFSKAMLWGNMATKGDIAELGLIESLFGKGLGRGMANTFGLTAAGLPVGAARVVGDLLGQGRIPNTVVWAGKGRELTNPLLRYALKKGRVGSLAGKVTGTGG